MKPSLLGATVTGHGVTFRAFMTAGKTIAVRILSASGETLKTVPMYCKTDDGIYEIEVPGTGAGTFYKFVIDGVELPDPYARFLPKGVHGPAEVMATTYAWRVTEMTPPPLSAHVIYELHVGTFTKEGTYLAAKQKLPELVALGITTIELMPVAAFAGKRGWGYDGVALYAPFAPYGSPDELRALVDSAHELGLSVLLDVVYNHFGPAGNYLSAYSPKYFTSEIQNGWGDAPNFAHDAMRRYVLDNASYWLQEFRFDGLRLDAIHAIADPSPTHIFQALSEMVSNMRPQKLLIGEDDRNDPALITSMGLHGLWADDFHHQIRVTLTKENEGYYRAYKPGVAGIAEVINKGWLFDGNIYPPSGKPRGFPATQLSAECFVYCIQNHDQIGNRATGDRLSSSVSVDAYCAISLLFLCLPMTPLLFMGQEWGASSPFLFFTDHDPELGDKIRDGRRKEFSAFAAFASPELQLTIPDPQDETTYRRSALNWEECSKPPHDRILNLYRKALALRRDDAVLRHATRAQLSAKASGDLLSVNSWHGQEQRRIVINMSDKAEPLNSIIEEPFRVLCSSSSHTQMLAPWTTVVFGLSAPPSEQP